MSTTELATATTTPLGENVILYILRKDLRVSDNPILQHLSSQPLEQLGFSHLIPVYVIPPHHIEVSGFIPDDDDNTHPQGASSRRCPYPEARSREGKFWRCGPLRAKFIAESVWHLKESLRALESDLAIRIGYFDEVVRSIADEMQIRGFRIGGVWITSEEGTEEKADEAKVAEACRDIGCEAKFWTDEKYFIDDRDLTLPTSQDLPDVFTTYRKSQEPLRTRPRKMVSAPSPHTLPPFPLDLPGQAAPFVIPDTLEGLIEAFTRPVRRFLPQLVEPGHGREYEALPEIEPGPLPEGSKTAHPFVGGEGPAHARLRHVIHSGAAAEYKATRNGLLGLNFSTKLSAYLAVGCITARQVHWALLGYEDGTWDWHKWGKDTGLAALCPNNLEGWNELGRKGGKAKPGPEDNNVPDDITTVAGYKEGENEGTAAVRMELLWRDYMRLCSRKFGVRLFTLSGFRKDEKVKWKSITLHKPESPIARVAMAATATRQRHVPPPPTSFNPPTGPAGYPRRSSPTQSTDPSTFITPTQPVSHILYRCLHGTTGQSLIDATARELFFTGYTSNRARQNFASFFAKHLGIDWRLGAEWYECCLVDYDVCSNYANWQYVAGVGNDPRGEARIFNPVKQGFEYDTQGKYVRAWVTELRPLMDTTILTTTTKSKASITSSSDTAALKTARPASPGGEGSGNASEGSCKSSTTSSGQGGNAQPPKRLENIMQPWTTSKEEWAMLGWNQLSWQSREMWERPVLKIDFRVEGKPGRGRRGFRRRGMGKVDRGGKSGAGYGARGGGSGEYSAGGRCSSGSDGNSEEKSPAMRRKVPEGPRRWASGGGGVGGYGGQIQGQGARPWGPRPSGVGGNLGWNGSRSGGGLVGGFGGRGGYFGTADQGPQITCGRGMMGQPGHGYNPYGHGHQQHQQAGSVVRGGHGGYSISYRGRGAMLGGFRGQGQGQQGRGQGGW